MHKKGWIRIVESFIAILLLSGIIVIVLQGGGTDRQNSYPEIYNEQRSILREIQMDDSLRGDILSTSGEVSWNDESFPLSVKNKILSDAPDFFECEAKICFPGSDCLVEEKTSDVFSESVLISANLQTYNPKVLRIFCWNEED